MTATELIIYGIFFSVGGISAGGSNGCAGNENPACPETINH